ncbi:Cysteine-rich repeat-containing protein [Strongyloides ratti]|uniref:Cysteine-rich repeat-containing protein n=1 Tax=Strongyloides ratti TaxID=34506 RepID=A0A090KRY0_STRRB|nr:Cysteine-rich repeat-containing protein [Strongyloides ratti]CEF60240.1 Cysteine-rich repeat-containing protein [Strongyloides ratti]
MMYIFILKKFLFLSILLITFSFNLSLASEDYRYHCPSGLAKKDNTGVYAQCLPGDYNIHTCGDNYYCFFSGFNYICCPEGKDIKTKTVNIDDIECPFNSFVQLDGAGEMIQCKRNNDCIGLNSQCNKGYCCSESKKIEATNYRVNPRKKEKKVVKVDLSTLDCPHPYLTVLNDESLPTVCSKFKPCSSSSEDCLSVGKVSICCEKLSSAADVDDSDESTETGPNILKVYEETSDEKTIESKENNENIFNESKSIPSTTKKIDTTTEVTIKKSQMFGGKIIKNEEPLEITETTTLRTTKKKLVGNSITIPLISSTKVDEELTKVKKNELEALPITRSKIHSSKNIKTSYDAIKLEPHFMGGYQKVEQEEDKNNKRIIVQKFLMDQIKKGWPYEDQFYWPEGYSE